MRGLGLRFGGIVCWCVGGLWVAVELGNGCYGLGAVFFFEVAFVCIAAYPKFVGFGVVSE